MTDPSPTLRLTAAELAEIERAGETLKEDAMSKPTPGEWKAVRADLHEDDDPDPSRWAVVVDGPKQFFIATIENGAPGDCMETEAANAHLIAAAPDLLAACKALLHNMAQHHCNGCHIEKARAAIAKAEPPEVDIADGEQS